MTMSVLSDAEQELSVIWDTDTGRAYGYVTSGPGHAEMLQAFMDGLETHIAAYEPHELSHLWDEFVKTVEEVRAERVAQDEGTPPEAPQEPPPGPPPPEPSPEPTPPPDGPQEPAQEPTGQDEPVDPTPSPSPSPDRSTSSDGDSVTLQEIPCWNCDGKGIEAVTGQKCGVCQGEGVLHTPTSRTTA